MKVLTQQEILQKLTALCANAEHCRWEMTEKMRRWEVDGPTQEKVMQYLVDERFVDDERYCRAFVKDKIRYNKWGRRKVEQALYAKHIDADISRKVLDEVSDTEYLAVLRPLLQGKRRQLGALKDYETNARLVRFALGRGFTMDIIRQCLDTTDVEQEDD